MLRDDISVGRGDLKRTVWKIHLNVFAKVSAEPFLLSGAAEISHVLLQARYIKQLALGGWDILGDNNVVKENAPNIVVVDPAGRAVFRAILAGSSPEISLSV
jgi:hypothetical protein